MPHRLLPSALAAVPRTERVAGMREQLRELVGQVQRVDPASRLLVLRAAHAKDRGTARLPVEAAMAKMYATEAAQRIIDKAVQVCIGKPEYGRLQDLLELVELNLKNL